jgi:hypothetical protein
VLKIFFDSLGEAARDLGLNGSVVFAAVAIATGVWLAYRRNRAILLESGDKGIEDEIGLAHLTPITRSRFRIWLSRAVETLDRNFGSHAYSARSYLWCLKFAVAYSTIGAYLSWAISNHDSFGVGELVPGLSTALRAAAFLVFVLLAVFTIGFRASTGVTRVLALAAIVFLPLLSWMIGIPPGLTIISAVPAFALAFVVIGGRATLPLFVSGAVFAILMLLIDADPTTRTLIRAFAIIGLLYGGVAAVALPLRTVLNRKGLLALANLFAWSVLALVTLAVVGFLPDEPAHPLVRYLLCFLIVIPLVNSVFDWLALETARFAVRRTAATGRIYHTALYDVAAGAMFLLLSVIGIVAALSGLNAIASVRSGAAIIDIGGIAREVQKGPFSVSIWWVYVVLFSTLLPGLLHLAAASTTLLTANLPARWYDWHREGLREGLTGRPRRLFYHSCFMTMVTLSSALVILFWLALFIALTVLIVSAVPLVLENVLVLVMNVTRALR